MSEELTDCPKCNEPYYYKRKEKCLYCDYDKSYEDLLLAVAELKEAIAIELIKVVKWVKNIFMEEVE